MYKCLLFQLPTGSKMHICVIVISLSATHICITFYFLLSKYLLKYILVDCFIVFV